MQGVGPFSLLACSSRARGFNCEAKDAPGVEIRVLALPASRDAFGCFVSLSESTYCTPGRRIVLTSQCGWREAPACVRGATSHLVSRNSNKLTEALNGLRIHRTVLSPFLHFVPASSPTLGKPLCWVEKKKHERVMRTGERTTQNTFLTNPLTTRAKSL
jgi:hypothetical protein